MDDIFDGFLFLNVNLPEFFKVCINLNKENIWNNDRPFNFNKAKLAMVNGNVNKNFPPIANKIAKTTSPINNNILRPLEIFFEAIFAKNLNKKYKLDKISTV